MKIHTDLNKTLQSRNFRHGMLYTLFSFLNSGIGFILLLILAKYLPPTDYGSLNLFTTFVTLLNIIIALCTTSYITVSFFHKSKEELRQIILISFCTATCMLIIFAAMITLFPNFVERSVGVPTEYLWLGLMICYLGVFNNVNLDIWRLEEKPLTYGIYGVSFAVCNFMLTIWLIVCVKLGWSGRVYAWFILGIIYFIVSLIFLTKRKYIVLSRPSLNLLKETYLYSLPLIPHTASFWLKQGLDRYIINYFHEQAAVGYFSFAMNLAAIITIVGQAFNATNSVYLYKRLTEGYNKVKRVLRKQTKIMTMVFLIVSIGVGLFAFSLIHFFLPHYNESIKYIFPLCAGAFFQCLYLLWVNYLFFYKKTRSLMHITISTALIQITFSIWLTRYSPMYTAWISTIVIFLTMYLVRRKSKQVLSNEEQNNYYQSGSFNSSN